jgi:SlyX protein
MQDIRQELEQKIIDLESQLAFQEDTIETLNQALSSQQRQLDDVQFKLKHVLDKVKSMEPSNIASASEETPPPHY